MIQPAPELHVHGRPLTANAKFRMKLEGKIYDFWKTKKPIHSLGLLHNLPPFSKANNQSQHFLKLGLKFAVCGKQFAVNTKLSPFPIVAKAYSQARSELFQIL